MIVWHPAGHEHSNLFHDTGGACLNIEFPNTIELGASKQWNVWKVTATNPFAVSLALRIRQELYRADELSPFAIEGLANAILAESARIPVPLRKYMIENVKEELRARFADRLSLRALATQQGVHPAHLSRAFHKLTGLTLTDYVRLLRIHAAISDMRGDPSMSLAQIAAKTGFADQSHFTRTFRRYVGQTPNEFRRSLVKSLVKFRAR
jgi:AraC family transcriptional regulator